MTYRELKAEYCKLQQRKQNIMNRINKAKDKLETIPMVEENDNTNALQYIANRSAQIVAHLQENKDYQKYLNELKKHSQALQRQKGFKFLVA